MENDIMGKFIHIVFGDSAAGLLKNYFEYTSGQQEEVISFREDHSTGPINEIDTENGLQKRIQWFKKMFQVVKIDGYFDDVEKEFIEAYEKIKNIGLDASVVIWHGENTADQVGLRYLSALLSNRTLYEVNVSEAYRMQLSEIKYKPRSLAECMPEEVELVLATRKKIDITRCLQLVSSWEVLRHSKETLRVLKDNRVIGVDESYYDKAILSNCTFNFQKALRIVGYTMGESDQLVGDTYIDYRLRQLIESGKIEYRGRLDSMRDFEIRVN